MMDTTGLPMPMVYKSPTGDRSYEGKIFYLGIIDILQQYTARKRAETNYRLVSTFGGQDPSCVHPTDYADRFIRFFDEYSRQSNQASKAVQSNSMHFEYEMTQIEVSSPGKGKILVDVKTTNGTPS